MCWIDGMRKLSCFWHIFTVVRVIYCLSFYLTCRVEYFIRLWVEVIPADEAVCPQEAKWMCSRWIGSSLFYNVSHASGIKASPSNVRPFSPKYFGNSNILYWSFPLHGNLVMYRHPHCHHHRSNARDILDVGSIDILCTYPFRVTLILNYSGN